MRWSSQVAGVQGSRCRSTETAVEGDEGKAVYRHVVSLFHKRDGYLTQSKDGRGCLRVRGIQWYSITSPDTASSSLCYAIRSTFHPQT